MSEHDHHNNSENPLAGLVGKVFYLLIPIALIVMMGVVGAAFIQGGGYQAAPPPPVPPPEDPSKPKTPPPPADQMAMGKKEYMNCQACHGADGLGVAMGPQKMAPSLSGSKILMGNPEAALLAVHKGIYKEPGSTAYVGIMAPLEGLGDEKIAAILTYARNSFGNKGSAITVEQSKAVREKYADKAPLVKRAEIEALLEE